VKQTTAYRGRCKPGIGVTAGLRRLRKRPGYVRLRAVSVGEAKFEA
jgi:hypothetical protein